MKFLTFSFKNDAMWTAIFACGPVVAVAFIFLVVYLFRFLR